MTNEIKDTEDDFAAPEGTVVRNKLTGERFIAIGSSNWKLELDRWREDSRSYRNRLDPICRRAAQRGTWDLYNKARAAVKALCLPCPMPLGHVMFDDHEDYTVERGQQFLAL